jgi:hypothetical protein
VNVAVWIATGLLAAMFLLAGAGKLTKTKGQLLESSAMAWAEDFSPGTLKFIGSVEVAGAAGLVLPGVFGVATWLVPAAAIGLAVLMAGAIITHVRRGEFATVAVNVVLLALAVFVAVERIGPQTL